jgi:3-oxoacyl-[acyl-carrier-protein] synthase-3
MKRPTLNESTGAKHSRIYALGASRGDLTVTNDDIAGPIESSDEWIRQRTGVVTRKRASSNRTVVDMAVEEVGSGLVHVLYWAGGHTDTIHILIGFLQSPQI